MIVFDELKKNDPHLRVLVIGMLAGLFILVAGLWWVQIVSSRDYQEHLETQSFRTVRIPAVRGKILDRNGFVLAENRAVYNVSLYLEELSKPFRVEYTRLCPVQTVTNSLPFWKLSSHCRRPTGRRRYYRDRNGRARTALSSLAFTTGSLVVYSALANRRER
jgi:penicillin-binding protein 2